MSTLWLVGSACYAGAASAIGPCCGPRYVVATALTASAPGWKALSRLATFAAGSLGCSLTLILCSAWLAQVMRVSQWTYSLLGIAFLAYGAQQLLVRRESCATPRCKDTSPGMVFAAGAATSFALSPCCAPLVAAVGSFAPVLGGGPDVVLFLAAFASMHVAALVAVTGLFAAAGSRLDRSVVDRLTRPVTAGLMLAIGSMYVVCA